MVNYENQNKNIITISRIYKNNSSVQSICTPAYTLCACDIVWCQLEFY